MNKRDLLAFLVWSYARDLMFGSYTTVSHVFGLYCEYVQEVSQYWDLTAEDSITDMILSDAKAEIAKYGKVCYGHLSDAILAA